MRRQPRLVRLCGLLWAMFSICGLGSVGADTGADVARSDSPPAASASGRTLPSAPAPPLFTDDPTSAGPSLPVRLRAPQVTYHRRYNLVILGGGLLIATWGADRLLTQQLPAPLQASWMPWIPLIGPWSLLYEQTQIAAPNSSTMFLLILDGVLQAGGLTIGVLGFVLHKKRLSVSLPPPKGPTIP